MVSGWRTALGAFVYPLNNLFGCRPSKAGSSSDNQGRVIIAAVGLGVSKFV